MLNISNIPDQKTPARPVEVNFGPNTGTPSGNKVVALIGHAVAPVSGNYVTRTINNAGDPVAAATEAQGYFGGDCELSRMVVAAIKANQASGQFVNLLAVPLASGDTGFGTSNQALLALDKVRADYIVSPYDGDGMTNANRTALKAQVMAMSGPNRVSNNQFGTFGTFANRAQTSPASLFKFDTQFLIGFYLRDTGSGALAPAMSLGEEAAAATAILAGNPVPYNPVDDIVISNIAPPAQMSDWISVGAFLESEAALNQGWTPLRVFPNGTVAFVRSVTGRISPDGSGSPVVTAYYDVQDFNVLYFWRETVFTRFSQTDFKQRKASAETAKDILAEVLRLAGLFQDQQMFQAVRELAKEFVVQRSTSDRSRFNVLTPVNVIPGLHVIATNVLATTEFDTLSI